MTIENVWWFLWSLMAFFSLSDPFLTLLGTMPRRFVSKGILQTDRTNLEKAFNYRVEHGGSLKAVAEMFEVKSSTLGECFYIFLALS